MDSSRLTIPAMVGGAFVIGLAVLGVLFVGASGAMGALVVGGAGLVALAATSWVLLLQRKAVAEATVVLADLAEGRFHADALCTRDCAKSVPVLFNALDAAARAFKYEKGLNKGLLQGIPTPFLLVDAKERALFTNQACLDMVQIDGAPGAQLGRTLAEIFYNDPTRQTAVGKSIKNGEVFRNLEVTITGHKGGQRHVLANVCPLYDLDGVCIGGFCIYVDMTDLKTKEVQVLEQNRIIARTAEQADSVANAMASAAEELAAQVEQARRGAEAQQQRIHEAATAMEEMSATVLEVARNASLAAEESDAARGKAQEGAAVVTQVVEAINQVEAQAQSLKGNLAALGQQAEAIGRIMNVITDIADQTNLLALNAAIEAARAGEAGRGFAVVADEVRKLAEKTMTATKEVGDAIAAIQSGTRGNIQGMERAAQAVDEATRLAHASGLALQEIVRMVVVAADQVRSIATAAEEQSATTAEINRSVDDINRIAAQTSTVMGQSAQAVSELARETVELHAIIGRLGKS